MEQWIGARLVVCADKEDDWCELHFFSQSCKHLIKPELGLTQARQLLTYAKAESYVMP
jgi:hypothetical protein